MPFYNAKKMGKGRRDREGEEEGKGKRDGSQKMIPL